MKHMSYHHSSIISSFDMIEFGGSAEAPCSHIVELARAEVRGNDNPNRLTAEFSRISEKHAEEGCHALFRRHGCSVPLEIRYTNIGPENLKSFPYLLFSDWATYLLNTDRLPRQLCGVRTFSEMRDTLREFWRRFRLLHPRHEIFGTDWDLSLLVPVFSHTDEGRSYKHHPIWILSTHGCIGRGTQAYIDQKKHLKPLDQRQMGLNFVGSTWSTQFMFTSCLRSVMVQHPETMDHLVKIYAADMADLAHNGISSRDGDVIRFLHVGNKGGSFVFLFLARVYA